MSRVCCTCDFDGAACKSLPMLCARQQLAKDVLCARQGMFSNFSSSFACKTASLWFVIVTL